MQTKYLLGENQIPTHWYNVIPDLPGPPAPVLHPGTQQPVTPQDLLPLFPMALIEQEVSRERWIPIPEPGPRGSTGSGGPRPLFRAHRLEQALGTPARIYYKYEGVSPAGLAQAEHGGAAGLLQQARRARSGSRPRPARGSGARSMALAARCSGSSAPSTW